MTIPSPHQCPSQAEESRLGSLLKKKISYSLDSNGSSPSLLSPDFFFFKQSKLVFFNFLLRASSKYMSQCGLSLCWFFFPQTLNFFILYWGIAD